MRKDFDTGQNSQIITYRQLYSLGHRLISFLLCLALLGTLFLQSPGVAAANTEVETDSATSSTENDFPLSGDDLAVAPQPEVTDTSSDTNTPAVNLPAEEEINQSTTPTTSTITSNTVSTTSVETNDLETVPITQPIDLASSSTSGTEVQNLATTSSVTTAATSTQTSTEPDVLGPHAPSTELDVIVDDATDTVAASTNGSVIHTSASDDSMMQFDRTKCTPVAGGSYYCQTTNPSGDASQTDIKDGVHALPDADGDLEIFLVKDGQFTQLTFNTTDDAAPSYDPVANAVVWHRLINERYQIMVYDFATKAEKQLTNDSVNNMQPVQSGKFIAWQRWVDNNWQIMLYDGKMTTQLTHSAHHNIAPAIRGNYLLWKQQRANEAQSVEVYDLLTKQQYTISDPDGGVISNPRMMLLYESEFDNGDVVTRGLDLATNEIVPIESTPIPLPENIPNSEPLDEVRALVTKTTNEDDEDGQDDAEPKRDTDIATTTDLIAQPGDIVITNDSATTTTATSTADLVTATSSEDADLTLDLSTTNNVDLISEYDVFVAPFSASTTDVVIEDLIDEEAGSTNQASSTGAGT